MAIKGDEVLTHVTIGTNLQEKDAEFAEREKSLTADIEAAETKEEREAVEDAVNAFDTDLKAHEERKANLTETINTLRHELEALEAEPIPAPANVAAETKNERKMSMNIPLAELRKLPANCRAFDALPEANRAGIMADAKTKDFIANVRKLGRLSAPHRR